MKERPILFSTDMVKSILEGRKTQTRRIMRIQPSIDLLKPLQNRNPLSWIDGFDFQRDREGGKVVFNGLGQCAIVGLPAPSGIKYYFKCPYGKVSDLLWVRETWNCFMSDYYYRATDEEFCGKWKPSIFMPKEATRIWLEVVSVRVEKLLDISEEDSEAEGVLSKAHYLALWDRINGEGSTYENPWVWVIEFRKHNSEQEDKLSNTTEAEKSGEAGEQKK